MIRIKERDNTTYVEPFNSFQLGQETFPISNLTSAINCWSLLIIQFLFGFSLFRELLIPQNAGEAGIEPATPGFGGRCSTNWATLLNWKQVLLEAPNILFCFLEYDVFFYNRIKFFILHTLRMKLFTFCDRVPIPCTGGTFNLNDCSFTIASQNTMIILLYP